MGARLCHLWPSQGAPSPPPRAFGCACAIPGRTQRGSRCALRARLGCAPVPCQCGPWHSQGAPSRPGVRLRYPRAHPRGQDVRLGGAPVRPCRCEPWHSQQPRRAFAPPGAPALSQGAPSEAPGAPWGRACAMPVWALAQPRRAFASPGAPALSQGAPSGAPGAPWGLGARLCHPRAHLGGDFRPHKAHPGAVNPAQRAPCARL